MMENIQSMEQFFTLIRKSEPTVIVFSADWCPDCHFLDRFMDEVVEAYSGKFAFFKVDRDKFIDICETFDVMGIPSFIAYQNGEVVSRFVHSKRKTRPEVESFLNDALTKVSTHES
jgi:thioredoxin-like negative regulator of GroEL